MSFAMYKRENPRFIVPPHYPISNYSTDASKKTDMKEYSEELFHSLQRMPDPLKKNLADQFPVHTFMNRMDTKAQSQLPSRPEQGESTLSGITNFFSGVFNVLSTAVFRRVKPDSNRNQQMAPDWHPANYGFANGQADRLNAADSVKKEMSDCQSVASNCEQKLNKVRLLLNSKTSSSPVTVRSRRPRRVFVDPNSIEENFQDAFSPEEFESLANDDYIEYYSPPQYHSPEYFDAESPKMRLNSNELNEVIDIGNHLPEVNAETDVKHNNVPENNVNKKNECNLNQTVVNRDVNTKKDELVSSCEDKLSQLKALLQENRKKSSSLRNKCDIVAENVLKPSNSIPIVRTKDKRYKNPNRLSCDKRRKTKLKQNIEEDLRFATELSLDQSSFEESPTFHSLEKIHEDVAFTPSSSLDCFDEISGKFCNSGSTEDSFQIVFNDVPRMRLPSDCDSEDSFIVFEDSPDSCYTSNDVFGDSEEESDSDSEYSDSGCVNIQLSSQLSRTISNLTDDSLYTEDVVDFAHTIPCEEDDVHSGLLVNEKRKALKKKQPPKKVHFSSEPPRVHVLRVWAFAARQARAGPWERFALDRERFKRRIADVDVAVSWVLKPQHRSRIMFQRIRPWWNAQRRKELEEKAQLEKQQKLAEEAANNEDSNAKPATEADDADIQEHETNKVGKVGVQQKLAEKAANNEDSNAEPETETEDLNSVENEISQKEKFKVQQTLAEDDVFNGSNVKSVTELEDKENEIKAEVHRKLSGDKPVVFDSNFTSATHTEHKENEKVDCQLKLVEDTLDGCRFSSVTETEDQENMKENENKAYIQQNLSTDKSVVFNDRNLTLATKIEDQNEINKEKFDKALVLDNRSTPVAKTEEKIDKNRTEEKEKLTEDGKIIEKCNEIMTMCVKTVPTKNLLEDDTLVKADIQVSVQNIKEDCDSGGKLWPNGHLVVSQVGVPKGHPF